MQTHPLHELALSLAKTYRETEAKLFELIGQIDEQKIWRALGYGSLWEYATRSLGLAESTAYALIAVSRKSREIPALKTAVVDGGTSVSKLRRVLPVLTKANQTEWIQKARDLPKRQLEAEVASCAMAPAVRETLRLVGRSAAPELRHELRLQVGEALKEKLRRVQDLLSKKLRRPATLEEALGFMADACLKKNDPVLKAERAERRGLAKTEQKTFGPGQVRRSPVPAAVRHQVWLRDRGCCQHAGGKAGPNRKCESRRFIEIHHETPVALGGRHSLDNLTTLCAAHHAAVHAQWREVNGPPG